MSLKSAIAKPYARMETNAVMRRAMDPVATQLGALRQLVEFGASTAFGRAHKLNEVRNHD